MTENILARLFEHNNWANIKIIEACSALSADQLDAQPHSATKGTIRETLLHLVGAQYSYLRTLTLPMDERRAPASVDFADLKTSIQATGESLLAFAKSQATPFADPLETRDGYHVRPWVLMVQIINHAAEHREQISSMLTALGITPPDMDGWSYGEATNAMIPIANDQSNPGGKL